MDTKKEELLPYTMQMASKMLGLPQEKKCECGKWHNGEGYCAECREEMGSREDEEFRRECYLADKAKEKYYHDKYGD